MIRVKIGRVPCKVASGWDDLSFEEAKRLESADTLKETIEALRFKPLKEVPADRMAPDALLSLYHLIAFVDEPQEWHNEVPTEIAENWTWQRFEDSRKILMKRKDKPWRTFASLSELHAGKQRGDWHDHGACLFRRMVDFYERYSYVFDGDDITPDEQDAGIESILSFDYYPALDRMSGGNPSKHAELLRQPAGDIYMKLMWDKSHSKYNEKLYEIKRHRQGA